MPVGYAISGVFDLTPLVHTDMNADFKLERGQSRAHGSPLFWPAPKGKTLDVVVGARELPEFLRHSKAMADKMGQPKAKTRYEAVPGKHHFNVVADLADPHERDGGAAVHPEPDAAKAGVKPTPQIRTSNARYRWSSAARR